jgi:hypothetical protein
MAMTNHSLGGADDWHLYVSTGQKIRFEASQPAVDIRKLVLLCNTYDASARQMLAAQLILPPNEELPPYTIYSSTSVHVAVEEVSDLSDSDDDLFGLPSDQLPLEAFCPSGGDGRNRNDRSLVCDASSTKRTATGTMSWAHCGNLLTFSSAVMAKGYIGSVQDPTVSK